ncbi:MAG TPA: type I-E CRISPR-associated protein Cse1/CasA [Amycolatopsis sp.]|uniref:type I-E CRISPR-associated protein Cse1/CasA n=1 Tax=Amycolatopsis sp. TaxID=37632 RepID=UPI002B45C8A1|nr:type I-E CRISPR-associated protein Cse1/CasA [Amycolatopsis sp.]HKS45436.1 type I-E CRISPR-associated protein Cse1/CasA [Amycolatopsis sp.]
MNASPAPARPPQEKRPTFDLVHDPWIPVDSGDVSVGLADLLLHAHEFYRIAGETPPMTAALYRLVLAFAHRVYGPQDEQEWESLWAAHGLPTDPLRTYVGKFPNHFDLFHPERPFFQCPALASCSMSGTAKLVPFRAAGNNVTLFDHTTAADRPMLSPAEAARWLVTVQAYDTGGTKTPYRTVKSSERAPCNQFGCVLVEGATLKETLLLNMPTYEPESEMPMMTTADDRPAWETSPPRAEPKSRDPLGWTDLLTWPSRRILLSSRTEGGNTVVDGVIITPGTRLRGELRHVELMAAFQRPARKPRSKKPQPFSPVRLRERQGVWRHSQELLLAGDPDRQRPHTLEELSGRMEELIPEHTEFTLRVFGQQLKPDGGAIECWFEEEVPAPVALLRAQDSRVGRLVGFAVTLADEAGYALRDMVITYRKEFQAYRREDHAKYTRDLDLEYWPNLPQPFGTYLRGLGAALRSDGPETLVVREWSGAVHRVAHHAAEHWIERLSDRARGLYVAGKVHGTFVGTVQGLIDRFEAETRHYAKGEESA